MYSDSLWQLDRAAQALIEAKEELHRSRQEWDAKHQALEVEVQRLKGEMEVQEAAQVEKREVIQQVRGRPATHAAATIEGHPSVLTSVLLLGPVGEQESRDQVRKMGDTLRTLNGIFRNMQTDVEAMRAADLKDQVSQPHRRPRMAAWPAHSCSTRLRQPASSSYPCLLAVVQIETLRSDLHDKVAELTELRPIAETVHLAQARLKHCEEKLEAAKQAEASMADELQQREALIQELMIHKTELIADKDKLLDEVAKADSKQQQLMQQAKEGQSVSQGPATASSVAAAMAAAVLSQAWWCACCCCCQARRRRVVRSGPWCRPPSCALAATSRWTRPCAWTSCTRTATGSSATPSDS